MNQIKTVDSLSIDELKERIQAGRDLLLLDTLPKAHYQQIHLPGAANACVFEVTFLNQVAAIDADKTRPVMVYGVSDQTHDARTAAEKLLRAGYQQVAVLVGGLAAWRNAGYPLEGDAGQAAGRPTTRLAEGTFPVDVEASLIEWAGRNPNTTHRGRLRLSAGEVQIKAGRIEGRFTIDMRSIENINLAGSDLQPVLEGHLKSDDFFFVELFPEAHLEMTATPITTTLPASAPNYEVTGRLQLRGVGADLQFPATIVPTEDGRITAEAHFDFDRTRWGVIYGSSKFFEQLGKHLVFDLVSLQVRILTS